MTQKTVPASHRAAILGVIDPDVSPAATYTTAWIPMTNFQQLMAIIMAGTLGASGTVDAKLQQSTDSSGTGAKDITGAAITQLTQAGTDSDKQAIITVYAEDLDASNSFNHVQLSVTVGTATSDMGAIVLGFDGRYGPASAYDATTVDEIVIVA